jgi:hypothetical protein
MIMHGCRKPSRDEMRATLKSRRNIKCAGHEESVLPSFTSDTNFIYTYDTNLLTLPFFSSKQALQKFNKEYKNPVTKRGGAFENVYIIRCLFPGFYDVKPTRFYQGISPNSDRQLISSGYHKILKGYARLALSLISEDAIYNTIDTRVGLIVSVENIGFPVKNISSAPGFGLLSQYLLSLSDNSISGYRTLLNENTLVLAHKVFIQGEHVLNNFFLPINIGDDQIKIPVKGEGYTKYREREVGNAEQKYYREDSIDSSSNSSTRSSARSSTSNSWEVINHDEVPDKLPEVVKCSNRTKKKDGRCIISGGVKIQNKLSSKILLRL